MESSFAIANFFIEKSIEEKKPITPLQLVKFVYLSHGWYLGFFEHPLISDAIEAWRYGPLVPPIYHEFKKFGDEYITSFAQDLNDIIEDKHKTPQGEKAKAIVNRVWEVYKDMSGIDLSTITHAVGSPWYQVWHEQDGKHIKSAIIPNGIIKDYYQARIKENAGKSA